MEVFNISNEHLLNKRIFKKYFYENEILKKSQKNLVQKCVQDISLIAMLRPNIVYIPPYEDNNIQYLEVAIIEVNLNTNEKDNEISEVINKMIQYPIILFFNHKDVISISLCEKRLDKVTGENNVIEDILVIKDIYNYKNFDEYLISIMYLNNTNLSEYYKDLYRKTYALELTREVDNYEAISKQPLEMLQESYEVLIKTDQNIITYKNKIMDEIDIGKRVDLNMKLKQEEKKRDNIYAKLEEVQNG